MAALRSLVLVVVALTALWMVAWFWPKSPPKVAPVHTPTAAVATPSLPVVTESPSTATIENVCSLKPRAADNPNPNVVVTSPKPGDEIRAKRLTDPASGRGWLEAIPISGKLRAPAGTTIGASYQSDPTKPPEGTGDFHNNEQPQPFTPVEFRDFVTQVRVGRGEAFRNGVVVQPARRAVCLWVWDSDGDRELPPEQQGSRPRVEASNPRSTVVQIPLWISYEP